jgi:hypothetical protein
MTVTQLQITFKGAYGRASENWTRKLNKAVQVKAIPNSSKKKARHFNFTSTNHNLPKLVGLYQTLCFMPGMVYNRGNLRTSPISIHFHISLEL